MAFTNILRWSYWFSQPYVAVGSVRLFWLMLPLVIIAGALVIRFLSSTTYKKDELLKQVLQRFSNVAFFAGFLSLLWIFFRQERVPYFAFRFWLLIIAGIVLWWLYRIIIFMRKRVPQIRQEKSLREIKEKYLPKPVR